MLQYHFYMTNSSADISNRLTHVDALRGLAALAVCLFHFIRHRPGFPPDGSILKVICQYGYLGVEIFFVISGFIIPLALFRSRYRIVHFHRFLAKRVMRIDPPYLITAALSILLFSISSHIKGTSYNFPISAMLAHIGYLNDFLMLPWAVSIFWTLAIEFQYYVFISLCFPVFTAPDKTIPVLFCLVFLLAGLLTSYSPLLIYYSPLFACGFFCYLNRQGQIGSLFTILLLSLTLISVYHKLGIESASACLLACLLILFRYLTHPAWLFLGKISYSLYLLHIPIGTRIINLLLNIPFFLSHEYLAFWLSVGITILVAWGFHCLIERPSITLSQKIVYNRP
jgi:peptidoglycan/LPS O-acetylase OafA/YrhL